MANFTTWNLGTPRRRLAGAERGSRYSQTMILKIKSERVCATEHAPRNSFNLLERRHGLAELVERGGVVLVQRLRVRSPTRGEARWRRWPSVAGSRRNS